MRISESKIIVLAYHFHAFSEKICKNDSVQNDFVLYIIGEKDVRTPPLSIGENRRSLAVAVVELLNLHPPLFNSGADNSKNSIC